MTSNPGKPSRDEHSLIALNSEQITNVRLGLLITLTAFAIRT